MIETMDPLQIVTTIIAVLGIIGTALTSIKARKYLGVIIGFMNILSVYYQSIIDDKITEDEEREIGRRVIALAKTIDEAKDIPAGFHQ